MKLKYIGIAVCFLSIAIISCNSGVDQTRNQNTLSTQPANLPSLPLTNTVAQKQDSVPQTPTTTAAIPTATASKGALNPAHGQPGHRCDIAVGAPLTSAATNTTTPKATTSLTIQPQNSIINNTQPQLTVPATKTSAGLNPAHGQPGHRCDIAVGEPLNGKATSATTPVNLSTTPANASAPAPLQSNVPKSIQNSPFNIAKPQTNGAIQTSTAGLNPAHGQPGHDCKIAVGKPLKQ
jgi:hypothetical protein